MTLRTIVVIEDDLLQRLQAEDLLEAAGLHVAAFEAGDQAIDYIRQHRADVAGVFTDVKLATAPDGLEVARLITKAFPDIVIVVTSGNSVDRPDGLDEKVRYVAKPWLPTDVLNALIDGAQDD